MKLPLALVVYAVLAFFSAAMDLMSAAQLAVTHQAPLWSILVTVAWAVFSVLLGLGILRARPAWRIVALVLCWVVFALFVAAMVGWCIWPDSVSLLLLIPMAGIVALNLWFYLTFRRDDVRALFTAHASQPV